MEVAVVVVEVEVEEEAHSFHTPPSASRMFSSLTSRCVSGGERPCLSETERGKSSSSAPAGARCGGRTGASKPLRRRSGVRRSGLGRRSLRAGAWGDVLGTARPRIPPAAVHMGEAGADVVHDARRLALGKGRLARLLAPLHLVEEVAARAQLHHQVHEALLVGGGGVAQQGHDVRVAAGPARGGCAEPLPALDLVLDVGGRVLVRGVDALQADPGARARVRGCRGAGQRREPAQW